jgi:ubiquinone/menaquinone biosynthesis C-methylase UbiE
MPGQGAARFSSYDGYVQAEWQLFAGNPERAASAREAVSGMQINRVLDVGCGAGQELRPFLHSASVFGVGLDRSPEVGVAGRRLFREHQPGSRVAFVRAAAEHLPLAPSSVDVVVCRLVLPYTDNARALAEIARVLRPGGALLLKFQHARFYVRELATGLAERQFKSVVHACRVLVAGVIYHLTGSQPRHWITGESFQTMWLLRRELARNGLEIQRVLTDSGPATPTLLIGRAGANRSGTSRLEPVADRG